MTLLDERTIFERALAGEPIVSPAVAKQQVPVIDLDSWWVRLPPITPSRAPDTQILIREIRRWTGWSTRMTADALSTSHTTVQRVEAGRPLLEERSGDLRRRIHDLHDLLTRVDVLSHGDPARVVEILNSKDDQGVSPLTYLQAGELAKAYLASIDSVTPRRRAGLLVGDRPATAGTATFPLVD